MKRNILFIIMFTIITVPKIVFAQNPISPPGLYIADPTARVWQDGMLYVYGSRDDENISDYCSHDYWVMRSADLVNWEYFPNVFSSKGPNDMVSYNDDMLYAPDIMFKDGVYYLYYCQPARFNAEGVAKSKSPVGPFIRGKPVNVGEYSQIDPTVFIDDDGQGYYSWGQFNAKIAKLKPNMMGIDQKTIIPDVLTRQEHFFHEGNFMTKRNGVYYMVYACEKREHRGKPTPTCLCYATSDKPMGPYKFGGVIIDNIGSDPDVWNNHGSIVEFKGQWYVFYHRATENSRARRKACIEPITFLEDGSIPEVEMTSQGATGKPLSAFKTIEAELACRMGGNIRIAPETFNPINLVDPANNDMLAEIKNGDYAEYKYVDFSKGIKEVEIRVAPAKHPYTIRFVLDGIEGFEIGSVDVPGGGSEKEWETIRGKVIAEGVHALYLLFSTTHDTNEEQLLLAVDKFIFK